MGVGSMVSNKVVRLLKCGLAGLPLRCVAGTYLRGMTEANIFTIIPHN